MAVIPFLIEGHVIGVLQQWGRGRRYRLMIMVRLGIALACAGGASRHDEDLQTPMRLMAILALAMSFWPLEFEALRPHRWMIGAIVGVYLLLAAQMVPLPPALWAMLTGHAVYARIAAGAGQIVWRPLSLTPDLTRNALFALLPATAAGLGALYLDFRGRTWLAWGIVGLAMASAALGLVQLSAGGTAFHIYRESGVDSPVGLFANRNHQAALLACALPFIGAIAGMRVRDGADPRRILGVALAIAILLLFALVSTGSRMGLVLATIGTTGALGCYRASGHRLVPRRWRTGLVATGIAAALVAVVGLAALRGGAITRLAATDTVSETRAAMVAPLLATARAFMPLGAGFGSFDAVYRQFEPASLLSTIYMNEAHDEPLQLAIEGGVPALALLLLFLVWWGRTGWRVMAATPPGRRRTLGIAAMSVTIILMASSLVDYPLRTPLLGAIFAIACIEMARAAVANDRAPAGRGEK
jgi:hypothetical protein